MCAIHGQEFDPLAAVESNTFRVLPQAHEAEPEVGLEALPGKIHLQGSLAGQESFLEHSGEEQALVQKATLAVKGKKKRNAGNDISIDLEEVEVEEAREAGAVDVGHQIWQRLGLDQILAAVGFSHKTRLLTQVITLNRLIEPSSELAMSEWVARSALGDILKEDFSQLNEDRLYRNVDRLYGKSRPD